MKGATDFRPILSKEKKAGESSSYENNDAKNVSPIYFKH
jgi:hypothetical protein